MSDDLLLEVKGLKTHFFPDEGIVKAVDGVAFDMKRGETLCVVGESGCGKSVTARSILQIWSHRRARSPTGRSSSHACRHGERHRRSTEIIDLAALDSRSERLRRHSRQGHLHDLPGADDLAQPDPHHRQPDHRGDSAPLPIIRTEARHASGPSNCCAGSASPTPKRASTPTRSNSAAACASAP